MQALRLTAVYVGHFLFAGKNGKTGVRDLQVREELKQVLNQVSV